MEVGFTGSLQDPGSFGLSHSYLDRRLSALVFVCIKNCTAENAGSYETQEK